MINLNGATLERHTILSLAIDRALKRPATAIVRPESPFAWRFDIVRATTAPTRSITIQKGCAMGATVGLLSNMQRFAIQKASLAPALFSDYGGCV